MANSGASKPKVLISAASDAAARVPIENALKAEKRTVMEKRLPKAWVFSMDASFSCLAICLLIAHEAEKVGFAFLHCGHSAGKLFGSTAVEN